MKDAIKSVGDNMDVHIEPVALQKELKPKSTFVPHVSNASTNTFCQMVEKEASDLYSQQVEKYPSCGFFM